MTELLIRKKLVTQILAICLAMLPLVFSPETFADGIEKRVVFPKGKKTVSYKGKLPRDYADYDAYVLKARKGQTITVKLTTAESTASFAIYETKIFGPDEDLIFPQNELNRAYTGKLPITSEYSIQVYGVTSSDGGRSSGAAYTIEISLR